MCGVPNALTLEVVPWWPALFKETLQIEDGLAHAPARPGLGLTLDMALVEAHRVH